VRHAKAVPRGKWERDDRIRPLDAVGRAQASTVAAVLGAYGVTRVVSSSSTRCVSTVEPYAVGRGLRLRTRDALSEEGFAESRDGALAQVDRLLDKGHPAALCSHGPVLPTLIDVLRRRVVHSPDRGDVATQLQQAASESMRKGEVLVCHLVGTWSARATRHASSTSSASTPERSANPPEPSIVGAFCRPRIPGRGPTPSRRPAFTLR
jgi:8-oxo-dGTP diphosphatase